MRGTGWDRVRVLVRDLGSGEFAVRGADVTVDPGGTSLHPVLVADAAGAWVMARESASRRREVPFPFLAGDQPFFPMARPTLPRSGTTDVIVQSYGMSGSDLQARIVDLDGHPVRGAARSNWVRWSRRAMRRARQELPGALSKPRTWAVASTISS